MPPRRTPQFVQDTQHSNERAKVSLKLNSISGDSWRPSFKPDKRSAQAFQISQASTASSAGDSPFNASGSGDSSDSDKVGGSPLGMVGHWPCDLLVPEGIPHFSGEPMKVAVSSYMSQQQPQASQGANQGNMQLPSRAGPNMMWGDLSDCLKKLSQCLELQQAAATLQGLPVEAVQSWQQQQGPLAVPVQSFNPLAQQNFAAMPVPQGLPRAPLLPQGLRQMSPPQENQALVQQLVAQLSASTSAVLAPSVPDVVQSHKHDGSAVGPAIHSKGGQGKGKNGSGGTETKGAGRSKKNASKGHGGVPGGDCNDAMLMPVERNNPQQKAISCDHQRTFVALRINRLGYDAEEALQKHFSQFGKVDYVFVPHKSKRVLPTPTSRGYSHFRPSCLGFVVMSTEAETQAILALGGEQLVCGKAITVRCFKQLEAAENENQNETEEC